VNKINKVKDTTGSGLPDTKKVKRKDKSVKVDFYKILQDKMLERGNIRK